MYLYHGTSVEAAEQIKLHGFSTGVSNNWKVKSKPGFVYLSLAYAPFFAEAAKSKSHNRVLIKVSIPESKLYPDDDFIMFYLNKPVYTNKDLAKINLEDYKFLTKQSLDHLGNASAKPQDIKIIGFREFNSSKLWQVCDPSITPLNYRFMGGYYKGLSNWIYSGKTPESYIE